MPRPPENEVVALLELLPSDDTKRGQVLRLLREIREYRQTTVERELAMSQTDLSRIERGSRRAGDRTICRLLSFYQATRIEILLIGVLLGQRRLTEAEARLISPKCEI